MDANDRSITRFTMVAHASFHAYEMTIPLFVVVWLSTFDVSTAVLGAVVAVGYGLIGIGALPSGSLADSYGSKRLVVVSLVGMAFGFLLTSVATNVVVLAVALILWGAAASIYHPAGLSLLTRGTDQQGTALAYHGLAGNVGTAVGPLVAALLLTVFEWRVVVVVFALPALAVAAGARRISFEERAGGGSGTVETDTFLEQSKLLFAGSFVIVLTIAMLAGTYYRGVFTFLPDVLADQPVFSPVEIGAETFEPSQYAYAGLLLIGGIGQYVGGRLSDRVDPESAIVVAFVALVVVALLFVPAANAGLVPLLLVCAALGFFVFFEAPIQQALVGKHVPADVQGLSFGYVYLCVFGIGAVGSALAGVALAYGGVPLLFAMVSVLAVVALAFAGYLFVTER